MVFRHDLTRRSIEASLLPGRRFALTPGAGAVAGRARARSAPGGAPRGGGGQRRGDHAVRAQVARGPRAAARTGGPGRSRAGVRHADLLGPTELARLPIGLAWSLYNAMRFDEALAVAGRAVALWEELDGAVGLGEALVALSRQLLLSSRPRSAEPSARRGSRAGRRPGGYRTCSPDVPGATLVLTDQPAEALPFLERAGAGVARLRRHDRPVSQLPRARVGRAR